MGTALRFICGVCGKEYADFKGIFGDFVDHVTAGETAKDWIEVTVKEEP